MDNGKGSRNNGKGKNTPGSSTGASTTAAADGDRVATTHQATGCLCEGCQHARSRIACARAQEADDACEHCEIQDCLCEGCQRIQAWALRVHTGNLHTGKGHGKDEGKDQGKDEGKDKGDKGGGGKDKGDKGGGDGKGKEGKTGQDADRAWIAFFSGHCSYRSGGPTARASAAAAPSEGAPHGIPK